jgi:formiminoglutamase
MEPTAAPFRKGDPDDPRLGDVVQHWTSGPPELRAGQPVLLGFPCDEGVRRNHGRAGAAQAPDAIREQLYRLSAWDGPSQIDLTTTSFLDLGNVRVDGPLEEGQQQLGTVVGALLRAAAVPIILGGGHETAYGHYLGYVEAQIDCAILNVDAHLDVRPLVPNGSPGGIGELGGHSGSPFRQALEHTSQPLAPGRYTVLGAQRHSVARVHEEYVRHHQGRIYWLDSLDHRDRILTQFSDEVRTCQASNVSLMLTIDADAFRQADVPGVSAPNPTGLDGALWPALARHAGCSPCVRSLDLVEVNPAFDRDNQSARWAAIGVRQFLVGLASRNAL